MAEERDFLSRWSKRKAEARDGVVDDAPEMGIASLPPEAQTGQTQLPAGAAPDADGEDVEIPDELKDIDIDAMGYDDDFTVFLKEGVPQALRRKALRRLWRSDPVLACLDGLNDYEEDFTDAAVAVKGLESAYRIGKGYLFAEEEEVGPETEVADEEVAASEGEDTVTGDEDTDLQAQAEEPGVDEPAAAAADDQPVETAEVDDKATDPDEKA